MKRLLALLMAVAMLGLCAPAMAEGEAGPERYALAQGATTGIDLDGDGTEESVRWGMTPEDDDEYLEIIVQNADGDTLAYDTDILYGEAVYVADLDGDGRQEILASGDIMSDDYATYCLRYKDGALCEVLFPDAFRGDNTDAYYRYGYGEIVAIGDDGALTLSGSQDVLGTWFGERTVALTPMERFEFADDGRWVRQIADLPDADLWDYAALTLKAPLAYSGADGRPAGVLQAGERIMITASDKQSRAEFITEDGRAGALAISTDYERGWGWLVNGVPEDALFESVPYAD